MDGGLSVIGHAEIGQDTGDVRLDRLLDDLGVGPPHALSRTSILEGLARLTASPKRHIRAA
ncbi:hypothetical protein ITP53_19415 [Nonomuraea sp. K274]|uniref:Uncharacterized protein n=1 Tax=Nonomuraea cypriaca TaxID=1187855 RepID=A0A931EZ10_9ACTN|nr:hypothetical protein [Nonomuraea cypriaca]MBF8187865.1 hypothetical protein [Nonomuraea cypriaca]